jgi:hypothetical protein
MDEQFTSDNRFFTSMIPPAAIISEICHCPFSYISVSGWELDGFESLESFSFDNLPGMNVHMVNCFMEKKDDLENVLGMGRTYHVLISCSISP